MKELIEMFLGNFELWISIFVVILFLIIVVIICIVRLIIVKKSKKRFQNEAVLLSAVAPIMEIAEKYTNYFGEEKKQYVITRVQQFAVENKLNYDSKIVSDKIEELIDFSKKVNNKQDEEK